MASPSSPDLATRLAQLEKELRELRARVAALERLVTKGGEHPADSTIVRQKVTFDWQA